MDWENVASASEAKSPTFSSEQVRWLFFNSEDQEQDEPMNYPE